MPVAMSLSGPGGEVGAGQVPGGGEDEPGLPVAAAGSGGAGGGEAAGGGYGVRGRKVLIVDDDVRNAFAVTSILELYGLTVTHASSGRQGIEVLRSNHDIDLVLMDVMMPEMDGYATTAAIREMPQLADLPVIAATARATQGGRPRQEPGRRGHGRCAGSDFSR